MSLQMLSRALLRRQAQVQLRRAGTAFFQQQHQHGHQLVQFSDWKSDEQIAKEAVR